MNIRPHQPRTGLRPVPNPIASHDLRLAIEYRRPEELKPHPKNPRRHSRAQKRLLALSIRTYGFVIPATIDGDDQVIGGHLRIEVAMEEGFTEVPTIRLEHLTPEQAKALRLAENRLAEISTWDDSLVAEALKELAEAELTFDLEATGFTVGEIDFRIEESVAGDGEDAADAIPLPGPAVSAVGDLWLLGSHRVLCGDALEETSYRRLMHGKRAAMVFIDPPFNVRIEGHASGLGAIRHRDFLQASGEMSKAEFTAFLTQACSLLAHNSIDGSIHFICMDWRHLDELLAAGRGSYAELKIFASGSRAMQAWGPSIAASTN